MAIKATCPVCTAEYNLADRQEGKKIRCKHCQGIFTALPASASAPPADTRGSRSDSERGIAAGRSGSVSRGQLDNERDDRPARSRRDDYDDDDRPRRRDDDYRPRIREDDRDEPRAAGRSKKGLIWLCIIGFVLLAGGGVTAVILLTGKKKEPIDSASAAVSGLKSDNADTRREALEWLDKNQTNVKDWAEINVPLFELLTDKDPEIAQAAGRAHGKWVAMVIREEMKGNFKDFGGRDPFRDRVNRDGVNPGQPPKPPPPPEDVTTAAVDKLLAWASDNSNQNKQKAIVELGRRKEPSGARVIVPYLADFFERETAYRALRDIGAPAEKEVLPYLHHPDEGARNKARELLRDYRTATDKIIAQTIDDLNNADNNRRRSALEWVERVKPQAGSHQTDLSQTLEKLLLDPDGDTKHRAIRTVAVYATAESVPVISSALDAVDGKPFVDDFQRNAMELLGKLKDPRGAAAVARRLNHAFIHESAEKSLAAMGPVAQPEVLKYVNHPDDGARQRARKLIQGYGTKDDALIDQAIVDLRDTEQRRRGAAAQWLADAKLNEAKRTAVASALNEGLKSKDHGTQEAAVKALATWATKDNVPALVEMVETKDHSPHRHKAMQVLGVLKDERGVIPVVAKLKNAFDWEVASKAVKEMGPIAEPIVLNLLINDGDHRTQAECCRILNVIGTKQSNQLLRVLTGHKDRDVRQAAADALKAIQARQ